MIPWLDAEALRRALPYPDLMHALQKAFAEKVRAPVRHVHRLDDEAGNVLLLMPAWQERKQGQEQVQLTVKLVTVTPANRERGLPTVHSVVMLFDAITGAPLALLDGEALTSRRTAAASGLAARFLAREDSETLLVVGHGALAPHMAAAHCAARPIRRVRVWGRNPARAQQALTEFESQLPRGVALETAVNLRDALAQADVVTCATTSREPLLHAQDVRPGTHVDLVGGFKPDMREADDALIAGNSVFVDTRAGTLAEAGDLLQAIATGAFSPDAIRAELADLVCGRHRGRQNAEEITVFKSVGTAIEDLAAAQMAWAAHKTRHA